MGIPGKNLKRIGGTTLVARSIIAAKESRFSMQIIVSTDSPSIASEASLYGADVCLRPPEISGDRSSSEEALLHVLENLSNAGEPQPGILVFLQCTSPFTNGEDIDLVVQKLIDENADSALSVVPSHSFLWRPGELGWTGVNHDMAVRHMRQERAPEYSETGAVYVMKVEGFLEAKHRFFGKTVGAVLPDSRHIEIDEPKDLKLASRMASLNPTSELPFVPEAIVFDFDGVMTDNKVYMCEDGSETVRCDRSDGMGIELLRRADIKMIILSKEKNDVVTARAKKLQMEVFQGVENKAKFLKAWSKENRVELSKTCFVGNDINDTECMQMVGLPVAVADSHPSATGVAALSLKSNGGKGAVRELADSILELHGARS
jgi:N-acylneuraminate cytidylyltransferase